MSTSSTQETSTSGSVSTAEERRRLNDALQRRRQLVDKIKEERAKVVGLSRMAALGDGNNNNNNNNQQQGAADLSSAAFPPVNPLMLCRKDWKKSLMEMTTFQSIALQQALSQQIALKNLVTLQARQQSAPPAPKETKDQDCLPLDKMVELLKSTKGLEIRQEGGCCHIRPVGHCHHHHQHCHCQQQQQQPPPPPQPQPQPQPQPLPPPRQQPQPAYVPLPPPPPLPLSPQETVEEEEEETTTEKRVSFKLDCQPPPRRRHRIRAKIANLMWPGLGISWWMRHPVVKGLRRIFYVAWFLGCTRRTLEMRGIRYEPTVIQGVPDYLTFEICLKDVAAAVVSVYMNMHGPIRPLLDSLFASNSIDLREAFTRGSDTALKELKYFLENLFYHITDIQPTLGALGVHRKALLQHVIRDGQLFPLNDLMNFERERIGFDFMGRTVAIGDREAMLLIMSRFLRPLINLLINPMGFGLAQYNPTPPQAASLRIVVSLILYIYRRAVTAKGSRDNVFPTVPELSPFVIPDLTLAPVLRRLRPTLDYIDSLLREWAFSYVRRLRLTSLGLALPNDYIAKQFTDTEPFILAPDFPALPPPDDY